MRSQTPPKAASFELAQRGQPGASVVSSPTPLVTVDLSDLTGPGGDRWREALTNIQEAAALVDTLQKVLLVTAVYADEPTYADAASTTNQARLLKVMLEERHPNLETTRRRVAQERRIRSLEKELDSAIAAAAIARAQSRDAELAHRNAEQIAAQAEESAADVLGRHARELYQRDQELEKQAEEIRVLQTIIKTLSEPTPSVRPGPRAIR